ncbi:hypothetical protein GCM10010106_14050 [Thermopolyspora flexuosa]|nr:hypothetical protein GCM10010106_14050 [Thermopolyspora flexuosa]
MTPHGGSQPSLVMYGGAWATPHSSHSPRRSRPPEPSRAGRERRTPGTRSRPARPGRTRPPLPAAPGEPSQTAATVIYITLSARWNTQVAGPVAAWPVLQRPRDHKAADS